MAKLRLYDVTVQGYGQDIVSATSAGQAKAKTWRCDAFLYLSFGEFMKICRARLRQEPAPEGGYDYIRRQYGLDVKIGQRVTLRNEGERWDGKEGEVAYPGPCTAHVHILMDGMDRTIVVHPYSVVPTSPTPTLSSETEARR